jgi:hypothetical protein
MNSARRVTNFDKDLSDGVVLSSLILSHVPTMKRLTTVYQECSEKEHFYHNASNVIGSIKDIGLDYNINVKDILEPNPCGIYLRLFRTNTHIDMLLFCTFLYQHLPQFIARQLIEFRGHLGDKVVKEIELSNPASTSISYTVTLEGSSDFSVADQVIQVEPRATKKVAITFNSRFSKSTEARISFFSRRKGPAQPISVIVFNLKSIIEKQKPIKVFDYECKLYQYQQIGLEITNPLGVPGKFTMSLHQGTIQAFVWTYTYRNFAASY